MSDAEMARLDRFHNEVCIPDGGLCKCPEPMSDLPMGDDECGEVFYGWIEPGTLYAEFSVPRCCDLPKGHPGSHGWTRPERTGQ